jgi:hypothetical protein
VQLLDRKRKDSFRLTLLDELMHALDLRGRDEPGHADARLIEHEPTDLRAVCDAGGLERSRPAVRVPDQGGASPSGGEHRASVVHFTAERVRQRPSAACAAPPAVDEEELEAVRQALGDRSPARRGSEATVDGQHRRTSAQAVVADRRPVARGNEMHVAVWELHSLPERRASSAAAPASATRVHSIGS